MISATGARLRLAGVLPGGTLIRELVVAAARPRAMALRVAIPLVLAVPLVAGRAPTFWAATLLTVLVAMVGAVGSAMTLARARQSGLLVRLALSPRPGWRVLGGLVAAGVTVDLVQLLPVMLVAVVGGGAPGSLAPLVVAVLAALLLGHLLGCAVAVLAGGVAEVLLDVSVLLAPLLFLGGLFTGVPRTGWRAPVALADPFGELHSAWIAALGGSPAFPAGVVTGVAVVAALVCAGLLGLLSRPLLERR